MLSDIDSKFDKTRLRFSEHHFSHAASAFYPSPFDEAVILTIDGVGEWATASAGIGRGSKLEIKKASFSPFARPAVFRVHLLYRI